MARIRKFVCYRRLERPFTRYSKYKVENFVGSRPNSRLVSFDIGSSKMAFDNEVQLVSDEGLQIRDNALESARQVIVRNLEKSVGKSYYLQIRAFPHHILRENPLAAGAGADRTSTGMSHCFGKNIGVAAQIKKGKIIFALKVKKENVALGKTTLKRGSYKLPGTYSVKVLPLKA